MPALTAQQALPLQLEAFAPYIAETIEADGELAKILGNGNGGATRVSLRSFRARLKTALASQAAQVNLDTGSLPAGIGNKYDQMLLTPERVVHALSSTRNWRSWWAMAKVLPPTTP
jgi:hypothetical protein